METSTQDQQTLSEFFAPRKATRIWQIVLAVLLSLMILGAVYSFTKPRPEPVRMSTQLSGSTDCYLDVVLVSHWLLKVTGDDNYTLYEAMDPDGNWFILNLDDRVLDTLSIQSAAYEAYSAENAATFDLPEPVRLTGMTHALDSDDASEIATYYQNATASDITGFYGAYYFNEGVSSQGGDAMAFLIFGAFFGIFLLIVWGSASAQRKNFQKSEQRLYELGLIDVAEAEFSAPESVRFPKSRLVLSKQFAFCGSSGWMLPYSELGWMYQRIQRSYGVPVSKQILASMHDGKSVVLTNRGVNDQVLTEAARAIFAVNPDCLIGYSFENIKLYRQRVKEYKQNHSK